ncbi:MAG: ribosome silencing factor [Candidatus Omnitrophica bacterium]|nr:ribosome silencing factor [Candidatus Omnitrophota bacterium]
MIAARAALEKQAENVLVMDVRGLSNVTDFFVLCTAASSRQLDAIKGHLEAVLETAGCSLWHIEGASGAPWILMDFGPLVVHLLDSAARDFYRLEDLWADAPRIAVEEHPTLKS